MTGQANIYSGYVSREWKWKALYIGSVARHFWYMSIVLTERKLSAWLDQHSGGTSFVYLEVVRTDDGWVSNGGWQDGNIEIANTPEVAVSAEI